MTEPKELPSDIDPDSLEAWSYEDYDGPEDWEEES